MEKLFGRILFGKGIKQRLVIAFSVFIVLVMLMAGIGAWRLFALDRVTANMANVADVNSRIERLVGTWFAQTQANAVRAMVLISSDDPELKRALSPQLAAATLQISDLQKQVEALVAGSRDKALLDDVGAKRTSYLDLRRIALEKKQAGQTEEALALLNHSMLPAGDAYIGAIKSLAAHYAGQARIDGAEAAATAETGRNLLIGACAAAVLFGILFAWWITSSISRPLRKAASVARQVAEGDLTVALQASEISETGHLLQALAHMTDSLRFKPAELTEEMVRMLVRVRRHLPRRR